MELMDSHVKDAIFFCVSLFIITNIIGSHGETMETVFEWEQASPESQGLSRPELDKLRDILANKGTKTFLVIRNDKIVYEWYSPDYNAGRLHHTASLAKALVGGISLIIALNDGLINIDDFACQYIPSWKVHPEKSKITIRHLATHSSGIEDAEIDGLPHEQLPGWKGAFWRHDPDPFSIARDKAPIIFPPGTKYAYSNPGMAMLAYAVTSAIKDTKYQDIRTLLRERIMKPIGIPDNEWSIGYGKTYEIDGLKLVPNWGGGAFTARAVARVGRLMLSKGNWEGKQIIRSEWVEKAIQYAETPIPDRTPGNSNPASGLCWWVNFDGVWTALPRDAFAGAGAGHQILLVIPSLDMIVVRNGSDLGNASKGEGFWGALEKYLFNPLMKSVISRSPYPKSPIITGIKWDDNVIRLALGKNGDGSDNWAITWGDDDNLYTAYGDGYGFDPIVPNKLGLGFAKIKGEPPSIIGENIRSNAENNDMGKSGKKASGLLMVDGTLYMWARNADNDGKYCQLAISKDHAKTWSWCDWTFKEFGYLTFINFGKNYNDVPDKYRDYVYMVSHDVPSAYEPADSFVLLRVPRDNITDRESYEFFKGLDKDNRPIWTKDINQRGNVFTNKGNCLRSGISYNAGLKRFLWWQQIPIKGVDTRFKGGFAIYDAAEPWGPWTNVYYIDEWDIGPGETGSFPTKWMSADGRTCYLVFSGNDNFSVRKVTFFIAN